VPHSEIIRKFALQGPLSAGHLVLLGLVLIALMGYLAWRYARDTGSVKIATFLFLLRLGALLVVLWMLAGATVVSTRRDTRPKSVVFLVDGSASMGLVDAVDGSGETVRWGAPSAKLPASSPILDLDETLGLLQSARSDLIRLRQLTEAGDPNERAEVLWKQIQKSVVSATEDVSPIASDAARTDAEAGAELARIATFLKENSAALTPWKKGEHQAQSDQLDAAALFINAAIQRIEHQSQSLAAAYEKNPATRNQAALTAESKLSRSDKVAALLDTAENSWLKDLADRDNIERFTFSTDVHPVPGTDWSQVLAPGNNPADSSTDLATAMNRVAQESAKQGIDAVVMLTDGGHNVPADPREAAASLRGLPLFIVPIGAVEMPRDAILHHLHAPRAVFKNDIALIDAMVTAYSCDGEELRVELESDGQVVDTHIIDVASKMFDGRVSFQWKGVTPGKHSLRIRIAPVPKELTLENNEGRVEIEVMEDTIKVLVADDLPRWEFRYLVNLFKRDKHIQFDQLLFEPTDDSSFSETPSLPTTVEGWRKYRVVILGDISSEHLPKSQQEILRKYVADEGGNLIIIGGDTAMPDDFAGQPLAAMIPTLPSSQPPSTTIPFSLTVTGEGISSAPTQLDDDPLASERVWRDMTDKLPIYNLSHYSKPKPTAHVLISAASPQGGPEQEAFLSWQYVGLGRVVYLAAPVTYQLRYQMGDLYHHRFWGQLLRWAISREMSTGSKTVRLITDKTEYQKGDTAQVSIRLSALDGKPVPNGDCLIEAYQDGKVVNKIPLKEEPDSPGAYRGTMENVAPGTFTLRAEGATVQSLLKSETRTEPVEQVITVDLSGSSELNNPLCNLPLLSDIADVSGGSLTPPASLKNALAHVGAVPDILETKVSQEALWDQWIFLWLFVAFLGTEWIARKFWRMV
jgi:hypothetical protein